MTPVSVLLLALALALAVLAQARGDELVESDFVIPLTTENFSEFISQHPVTLVEFYAPWCGHCKKLAPKFLKAARMLKENNIPLASVDCISQEPLYWKNNIKGYPTLITYLGGEALPYEGPREVADIVDYMRRMATSSLAPVNSIEAFVKQYRTAVKPVVLVLTGSADSDMMTSEATQALDFVCKRLEILSCGMYHDSGEAFGLTEAPGFVLFPTVNDDHYEQSTVAVSFASIQGASQINDLRSWILRHAYPDVIDFREENLELMFSKKRPGFEKHVLLIIDKSMDGANHLLNEFREKSRLFASRCIFITVDISDSNMNEFTQNLLSDLNVSPNDGTKLMIIQSARTKIDFFHYTSENEISGSSIEEFVTNVFDGHVEASKVIEVQS